MTLHAVPSHHSRIFPLFYTLWSPPTIQNTLLKLPQLNLYWDDSILQVHPTSCKKLSASPTHFKYHKIFFWNYFNLTSAEKAQSRKYIQILTDPFSVSSKPFIWVGILFGNYPILLKAPPPSTTSLKESSVKISFRNSFPHHTLKLCAWTSLEGAFVEKENFRPITSWHVTLPSPQDAANYKVPRIATRFCYHYSETNRNLPSVMQKPITHQRTCKWWHKQPRTCKRLQKQPRKCKQWHK